MSYPASETCQIRFDHEASVPTSLVIHEGPVPRCGTPALPWQGWPAHFEALGAGQVTCGRCARCVS